jgi:hypothetical protein
MHIEEIEDKTPVSSPKESPSPPSPPLHTIGFQFFGIFLALLLLYIRKYDISLLGLKLGIIGGILPAECVVLSLLIGEMALREWGGIDIVEQAWEEVMVW